MIYCFSILFSILLSIKFYSYAKQYKKLEQMITPCVVLSLIPIIYLSGIDVKNYLYAGLITFGLVLASIADYLLCRSKNEFSQMNVKFLSGFLIFFVMQISYIVALTLDYNWQMWHIIPLAVLLGASYLFTDLFLRVLHNKLFKIILASYIFCISGMVFLAVSYVSLISMGAILFWISDLIFGINAFYKEIQKPSFYTWFFYGHAQFLIALSVLDQKQLFLNIF